MTKALASGLTRRRLLKGFTGGALGSALAAVGLGGAAAQVLRCDRGELRCRAETGDYCAAIRTDPNNCGRCGNVCESGVCNAGRCEGGATGCGDLRSDPNNCGRCGTVCESGVCFAGRCQPVETGCRSGFEECWGTCVRVGTCSPGIVSPANMQGWSFVQEGSAGGAGGLVFGPASPPLGNGSAQLVLTAADQGIALIANILGGTRLADIATLQYSTYRTSGSSPSLAASLQFSVDYDPSDGNDGWQGRLVYEPYRTETVETGIWQTWNPLAGLWWASGAPGNTVCPQGSPCNWGQVLSAFPEARINPNDPQVLFKAGSGWADFDGNVDALTINGTTFDFEPAP